MCRNRLALLSASMVAAVLVLAGVFAGSASGQAPVIQGSLSNFDALQNCNIPMDNFELDFFGNITPADFTDYYHGWGTAPRFDGFGPPSGPGTEVMWLDRANPVLPGQIKHFGVRVNPALPPTRVRAAWTKINKVAQIPVPFQWWLLQGSQFMVDWMTLSPTYVGPVIIQRDWAVSPVQLTLEQLQYDNTPVVWHSFDQFTLAPGGINTSLQIPIQAGMQAYLVRYSVMDPQFPGEPVTRFVTEALVNLTPTVTIRQILINFDLRQPFPGQTFDNVELDLFGPWLNPAQVVRWYDNGTGPGIPAWGVNPLVRTFPPGMFPAMPERGGVEVTWVDRWNPYLFGQVYHFGLVLDPAIMGPLPTQWTWVQAYWTTIDKCFVPVPWQFWQAGPGGSIRDIIRNGSIENGTITINRQYVTLPQSIPLDNLLWQNLDTLPWQPVPGDPIELPPLADSFFDVFVQVPMQAVLVRYTAQDQNGGQSRVINEAILESSTSVPDGKTLDGYYLAPSQPNPSRGQASITFGVPESGPVRVVVVDVSGRQIAVLWDGPADKGAHTLQWNGLTGDGTPAASGVYFYSLTVGSKTLTQRMVLQR